MTEPVILPVRIAGTASALPGTARRTVDLVRECMPDRDAEDMARRIGIDTRHFMDPDETVAQVAADVVRAALDDAGLVPGDLRRLILVNSSGGDHPIPATANGVVAALDLHDNCGAFDLNNACTGFVSGFDVGARLVATGVAPVAVVTVECLSRWIAPDSPRSYVVLGDAAGAVILDRTDRGGVLAADFGNDGRRLLACALQHGADERVEFGVRGSTFFTYAMDGMVASVERVLEQAAVALDSVDWFLLHQPNGALFDALVDRLGLPLSRTLRVVHEIGSVGAASIPVALDRLWRTGQVQAGHRVLMVGFGAGASRGAVLLEAA